MGKPTPQIDEGRGNRLDWARPAQPKGRDGRKSETGKIARLERSGEPPALLLPERVGGRVRSFLETGHCLVEGTGRSAEMKAKAIRTAGPAVRAKRFGALEGGASLSGKSESYHPGSALLVVKQKCGATGGMLDHHLWLTPGMWLGRPAPRRKPVVQPRPRPLDAKASR